MNTLFNIHDLSLIILGVITNVIKITFKQLAVNKNNNFYRTKLWGKARETTASPSKLAHLRFT